MKIDTNSHNHFGSTPRTKPAPAEPVAPARTRQQGPLTENLHSVIDSHQPVRGGGFPAWLGRRLGLSR